jgi:general secretion pathway protein D
LSGLIEDRANDGESRVPILGSIPLIGWLFRYENRSRTRTNTMIFLRPYVVRDEATSSSLALDRYDYMRQQLGESQKADNLMFRGFAGRELPPAPPRPAKPAPAGEAPAASPSAATPSGGATLIEVATFAEIAQARAMQRDLKEAGFDSYWESVRGADGASEVVRVRVAVDPARGNVADTLAALRARGLQPQVVSQ